MQKIYKNIIYQFYPEKSVIEFDFSKNSICSREDYIQKTSIFAELLGFTRPNFVLINIINSVFILDNKLIEFTNQVLLDMICNDYGVERIFILPGKDNYLKCKAVKLENTMVVRHVTDMFNHISKHGRSELRLR